MKNPTVLDFGKVFDDYINENQKKWAHDRSTTVGASEVYGCIREAFFNKRGAELGYEKDRDHTHRWGATERGNVIEDHFVVPAVSSHLPKGMKMLYHGDQQTTLVDGRSSSTSDGLITGIKPGPMTIKYRDRVIHIDDTITDCVGFEVKSVDPMINLSEEKEKHWNQTQVQMGLMRLKTKWKPHFTIILYVDASWLDVITPFVVEYDETVFEMSRRRAMDVFEVDDPNLLIPEGRLDGSCAYCAWRKACGAVIIESIPEVEDGDTSIFDAEIDEYVEVYTDSLRREQEAEKEKKQAQERLKEILVEAKTRKAKSPYWSLSWSKINGKKTLDVKAMEAAGLDLSAYEKIGSPYDRLTITRRKPK